MPIAKLTVDLEARLAALQAGLDKAGLLAERTASQIGGAFNGLKSVAATVGPALAASLSVAGIAAFLKETAAGIDALNDLSDATGASIENLSALEDAAARTGTQMTVVGDAIVKLNQQLADSNPNSGASQALKALGLDAEALRRIDPAEALLQVAQALDRYEDNGNKARLVQELFGKGVREIAPLLKDLAEAGQLNASITKEQADEVDRFNKELARLEKNATDAGRAVVNELLPSLNDFLEKFRQARGVTGGLGELFKVGAGQLLRGEIFTTGGEAVEFYTGKVTELTAELDKLRAGNNRSIYGGGVNDGPIRKVEAELQRVQQLADAYTKLYGSANAGGGRGFVNPPLVTEARPSLPTLTGPGKPAPAVTRPETYDDAVARSLSTLIAQTDTVKLAELNAQLAKLDELAAAGLDQKIVDDLRAILTPVDRGDVGPPVSAELEKINALLAQTDSAQLAEAQRTLALLNDELAKVDPGSARFVQLQEAILGVQDRLTDLADTFPDLSKVAEKEGKKIADELGFAFSSAFEDAVVRAESLKDVLSGLAQDISRILTRELVTEPLAKAAVDWVKSVNWGGLIAGIFGGGASANGNAFTPAGIQRFANGGVVTAPTLFRYGGNRLGVMGEAGAEGVLPLRRGPDGKLGVIAQGGGAMSVSVTNNFMLQGQMDRRTQAQIATDVGRSVQIAMRRNA